MFLKNLNAHGGFSPAAVAPPDAITPEQVLHHYPISIGAVRGDRHCPVLHRASALNFIP